jgi:hypothetical protein
MWIKAQLQRFFDQVPFDGLWLDMNEASNFCSGNKCKAPEDPAKLKGEGVACCICWSEGIAGLHPDLL